MLNSAREGRIGSGVAERGPFVGGSRGSWGSCGLGGVEMIIVLSCACSRFSSLRVPQA